MILVEYLKQGTTQESIVFLDNWCKNSC